MRGVLGFKKRTARLVRAPGLSFDFLLTAKDIKQWN